MDNFRLKLVQENKPVKRKEDVLLITGDGKLLLEDIREFLDWNISHDVMSIGKSIKAYPGKVQHYADVDAEEGKWVAENLKEIYPDRINGKIIRHTLGEVPWFDAGWDLEGAYWPSEDIMWHGSTALFAVLVGLEMGYKRIVLAGCPLDSNGHWCFPQEKTGPRWTGETYQVWFEFTKDPRRFQVRSMSGYTRILLSRPDKGYFHGFY